MNCSSFKPMPNIKIQSLIAVLLLSTIVGCGDGTKSQIMAYNDSEIRRLHNCYQLYIQRHGMKGPKNEEEFKAFLKSKGAERNLALIDMDASMIDDLFICDRDGEPYVVRYGINGMGPAIVFEAKGVNGGRMVALTPPREVTSDDEYQRLLNGDAEEDIVDLNTRDDTDLNGGNNQ